MTTIIQPPSAWDTRGEDFAPSQLSRKCCASRHAKIEAAAASFHKLNTTPSSISMLINLLTSKVTKLVEKP